MGTQPRLKAAVLVISTTAAKDPSADTSGQTLKTVFDEDGAGQWDVVDTKIVGDVVLDIQRSITQWTDHHDYMNLIVTTGGTGFATFDQTPEAISPLLNKHAPGLVHGMLTASLNVTPFAMMSRPVAGVRGKTVIITLPGSPKGAKENLHAVLKLLPHACQQAAGADSRSMHKGGVEKLEAEAGLASTPATLTGGDTQKHGRSQEHSHEHRHAHGHGHSHGHGHAMPVRHTVPSAEPQSNDPKLGPTKRHRESPYPMVAVDEALELIRKHVPLPQPTTVPVNPSLVGHVLLMDVHSSHPVPAFRASIVDGYAVTAAQCGPGGKGIFPVALISHASPGEAPPLKDGSIARITTGAPLPKGAVAVVMVEDTSLVSKTEDGKEEATVEILTDKIQSGQNIREVGSDIKAGTVILRKGDIISPTGGELGLLAAIGVRNAHVCRKPVIGVLSTGDEIVQHDKQEELRLGEVRDTNRPTILAALRSWGIETVDCGIARDKPAALEVVIRDSLRKVDILVTTGGVSMGELDLLKPTIERTLGGTIHFGRVAMKPGKPTTFATVPFKESVRGDRVPKVIFSLPGNPASAMVTLHLFVLPAFRKMLGMSNMTLPKILVTLAHDINADPVRNEYHRATVTVGKDGVLYASSTGGQRSSMVGSLKSANALLCLPLVEVLEKGAKVQAILIGALQSDL